jgi:hypothetical protein
MFTTIACYQQKTLFVTEYPIHIYRGFLKAIVYTSFFRIFLEGLAFFGGFPPEQPPYFHEYMKDVFHTRYAPNPNPTLKPLIRLAP